MIDSINDYLSCLDTILNNIPKKEKILLKELVDSSYGLINSNNIIIDIQYIDYLFCCLLNKKYINYANFLLLGKKLENIICSLNIKK